MGEFCFAMISSLLQDTHKTTIFGQLIGSLKMAAGLKKMAPRSFLGRIPRCMGSENGHAEDLRWMVSFKPIGTH